MLCCPPSTWSIVVKLQMEKGSFIHPNMVWSAQFYPNDNEDDEVWDETAEGQTITRELALKKCGKLLLQGLN